MKNLAITPLRIIPAALIVFGLAGVIVCTMIGGDLLVLSGYLIIAVGLLVAAMVYDIGTALGSRKNFIEDAEARGMSNYVTELKARKF